MSEKASKQDLLEKINSCEQRILALEKNRSTQLYNKRHEYRSLYCPLEELDLKFFAERRIKKHELQQEISRIRNNVNGFHRMLLGMKPDPTFVERLKETMEGIEASIVKFKEKQREEFESLLFEEQTTSQEISAFSRKLESWLSIPHAAHMKHTEAAAPVGGPSNLAPSTMPPAIMAFERFLQQTGGRQGGWDDYDHKTFLKTRSQYNDGNPAFLTAVGRELPTKTAEEISDHEQWYTEFVTLMDSKKKAIEAWKEEKQNQRKKRSTVVEEAIDTKLSNKQEMFDREREARFAKLEAWKAEQKLKQAEAEEERLKQQLLESKRQEREHKRRAALKSRVEEYVKSKDAELAEQKLEAEAKLSRELAERRLANRELEKFRERDMKGIAEKRKRAEAKEMERLERERKLEQLKEQVEVHVERDPSRLHRLTKGWEERKKADGATTTTGGGGRGSMSMPRRAVPTWRQRT